MNLFGIFQRKNKSNYYGSQQDVATGPQARLSPTTREAFVDFLLGRGDNDLADFTLLRYYNVCAPVADATDRISQEISRITPTVFNKDTQEFEDDHPVLKLLQQPNPVDTYCSLVERIVTYYLITGDSFMMTTGDIKKEPLELFAASTASMNINEGSDGFVASYNFNNLGGQVTFKRQELEDRFRYFNQQADKEVFQMKRFRTRGALTPIHGTSVLQSIYYEVEQYIHSSIHNLSLLSRGGSLSAIISTKNDEMLTDDQRQRIQEAIANFVSGAENAGRIGFLDAGIDYTQLASNNKDMDFFQLKKDTESIIYKRFKIPLPFINESTMTMANRETARLDFYDDAILPLLNRIFEELTILLMYRYPDSENKIITFDISKIPALEPRKLDQLAKLNKMGILSYNEQRAIIGSPAASGADNILVPINLVPIASAGEIQEEDQKSFATREEFRDLMRQQLNSDGGRRFSDIEIEEIADKEGLK